MKDGSIRGIIQDSGAATEESTMGLTLARGQRPGVRPMDVRPAEW